jgi:hypothetical protein
MRIRSDEGSHSPARRPPAATKRAEIEPVTNSQARQRGHGVVGKPAAGDEKGAAAWGAQHGYGDLRGDDGAEDIDVICGAKPLDRRLEDLGPDPAQRRCIRLPAERQGRQRSARASPGSGEVLDVRADGLDLKAETPQPGGKLPEGGAAGDESAPKALAAEAPDDGSADAGPGPDQQQVTGGDRLRHTAAVAGISTVPGSQLRVLGQRHPSGVIPEFRRPVITGSQ